MRISDLADFDRTVAPGVEGELLIDATTDAIFSGYLDRPDATAEKLRSWRSAIAKEHGVPAYVVFHDNTLHAIAQSRPLEVDQLRGISGVGEKKLERYGASLIELIRSERP